MVPTLSRHVRNAVFVREVNAIFSWLSTVRMCLVFLVCFVRQDAERRNAVNDFNASFIVVRLWFGILAIPDV